MADLDTATTTSYSDPIYDRLEMVAQRIRRLRWLIVGILFLCIAGGLVLRAMLKHNPASASAVAYAEALAAPEAERSGKLTSLFANDKATAYYRARCALDLAQIALFAAKVDEAKELVAKAKGFADQANNDELSLIVRLGQAAVAEDAKDLDAALADYERVEDAAGAKFAAHYLTAVLGAARVHQAQGKHKEVIERLEPVLTRSDEAAKSLMPLMKVIYWTSKLAVDGGPREAPKPAAAAVEVPAAAPAPADDGAAPAAPAADAAAPAPAPAAPAPN